MAEQYSPYHKLVYSSKDFFNWQDWNEATETGWYFLYGGNSKKFNSPLGDGQEYGLVEIIKGPSYNLSTQHIIQRFTNNVDGTVYQRLRQHNNANWTSWVRLDNFGYNSLYDLFSTEKCLFATQPLDLDANKIFTNSIFMYNVASGQFVNFPNNAGTMVTFMNHQNFGGQIVFGCTGECYRRVYWGEWSQWQTF